MPSGKKKFREEIRVGNTVLLMTQVETGAHAGSYRIQGIGDKGWKILGMFKDLTKARDRAREIALEIDQRRSWMTGLSAEDEQVVKEVLEARLTLEEVRMLVRTKKKTTHSTLTQVLDEWFEARTGHHEFSVKHVRDLNFVRQKLPEAFKVDPEFWTITTADLERWLSSLSVGSKRYKNMRANLVGIWNWACRPGRGYAAHNVAAEIEVPIIKARQGGHEVLTPPEFAAMLANVKEAFLPWLVIGGFAGLRTSEICGADGRRLDRLKWEDFDWTNKRIVIRPATAKANNKKRSLARIVPICDALHEWLEPWHKARGFVHNTVSPSTPSGSSKNRMAETKRLGMLIGGWRSNCLRASRASYRLAETNDLGMTAAEDGHTVEMLKGNYLNPRFAEDAKLWWSLTPAKVQEMVKNKIVKMG